MEFFEDNLYHIYNRENNRQPIFFRPENYLFFLKKVKNHLLPHCDILAWCLMPNHFHFLAHTDKRSVLHKKLAGEERNVISEGIRNLLSSYTQAINKQNKSTGSLFQQNTKAKLISNDSNFYGQTCFHYIHQNPMKAGLVKKMENWAYSSFSDYCTRRPDAFTNEELAVTLLGLNIQTFYEDSYKSINNSDLDNIL
ncbi:MAG TPA: transposase [Chitinophagaceae bacterium]|jgi:REP element-mobilizing transposase RayT|nr:transposase [Chitinophagaceae bacterium]